MTLKQSIEKINISDVAITATLILFLLDASRYEYISVPASILCIIALVFPGFRLSRFIWTGFILIFVLGNIPHLFEINNYQFIFIYWCIAVLASTFAEDFDRCLKFNAKLMIGIIFGLAATQKLLSGDYLNDSFFLFSSLTDNRLTKFLQAIHLLPKEVAQENWNALKHMISSANMPYETTLRSTNTINTVSQLFTYLVVIVESSISVVFLLPKKFRLSKYRDYFLYAFLFVTYSFANVVGFGCIITILGLAQCDTKRKAWVYILLFLLLRLYDLGLYKLINILQGSL